MNKVIERAEKEKKKKAFICTTLLAIVVFGAILVSCFIEGSNNIYLCDFIYPFLAGCYIYEKCQDFYNWILKSE